MESYQRKMLVKYGFEVVKRKGFYGWTIIPTNSDFPVFYSEDCLELLRDLFKDSPENVSRVFIPYRTVKDSDFSPQAIRVCFISDEIRNRVLGKRDPYQSMMWRRNKRED